MAPLKLNLVDDFDKLLNRGDAIVVIGNGGRRQLVIVCPGCGKNSASQGKHEYNDETHSYTPSIVHNKDLGGCGWHGCLTNGVFTEC